MSLLCEESVLLQCLSALLPHHRCLHLVTLWIFRCGYCELIFSVKQTKITPFSHSETVLSIWVLHGSVLQSNHEQASLVQSLWKNDPYHNSPWYLVSVLNDKLLAGLLGLAPGYPSQVCNHILLSTCACTCHCYCQGSVVLRLRRLYQLFIAYFLESVPVKEFLSRSILLRFADISVGAYLFCPLCVSVLYMLKELVSIILSEVYMGTLCTVVYMGACTQTSAVALISWNVLNTVLVFVQIQMRHNNR